MALKCQAFSDRLLFLVQKTGLNNRAFARSVGISENAATNYLKKGRLPEPDILLKIAHRLGKSVDWLLQDVKVEEHLAVHCVTGGDSAVNGVSPVMNVCGVVDSVRESVKRVSILTNDSLSFWGDDMTDAEERAFLKLIRKLSKCERRCIFDYIVDLLHSKEEKTEKNE